jgi:hypothetical protein
MAPASELGGGGPGGGGGPPDGGGGGAPVLGGGGGGGAFVARGGPPGGGGGAVVVVVEGEAEGVEEKVGSVVQTCLMWRSVHAFTLWLLIRAESFIRRGRKRKNEKMRRKKE